MTLDDLKTAVAEKYQGRVWTRDEGAPEAPIVVCGVTVQTGKKRMPYEKSISFNALGVPDDAMDKIEAAIQ